jgi:hypothetical protein
LRAQRKIIWKFMQHPNIPQNLSNQELAQYLLDLHPFPYLINFHFYSQLRAMADKKPLEGHMSNLEETVLDICLEKIQNCSIKEWAELSLLPTYVK